MKNKVNESKKSVFQLVLFGLLLTFLILMEFIDVSFHSSRIVSSMIENSILRILGGSVFLLILISFGYRYLFRFTEPLKSLIIAIPALLVSINNFPIIAFFSGRTTITSEWYKIVIYFIESLSVGFFEEIIFRGLLLILLLQRLPKTKRGVLQAIVISSLIFSLTHVFNLFTGGTFGNTMMQIGYSFLLGLLWAVMYLKTKNIWIVMLLHATYNFFGNVMFHLGTVENRFDTPTVILTVCLSIVIAVYSIRLFASISPTPLEDEK